MKQSLLMMLLFLAAQTAAAISEKVSCQKFLKAVSVGTSAQKLKRLLDAQWAYDLAEFPEMGTFVGKKDLDDRFADLSFEAVQRRKKVTVCQLEAAEKIPASGLNEVDKISRDLLVRGLRERVEGQKFDEDFLILSHLSGIHMDLPDLLQAMAAMTVKDYENMVSRLEKIPELVRQHEAWLRKGLEKKVTPVKLFLQKVPEQFNGVLTKKVEDSALYAPFTRMPDSIPEAERARLQARAKAALSEKALPALSLLKDYLVREYIPGARESIAWSEMPNGVAWYNYLVRQQTTTKLSAEELHALGLQEVERITGQMKAVLETLKFKGSVRDFNQVLLKDSKYYFDDPQMLLMAYRDLSKRIDAELPKFFGRLPRLPYGVRAIPDYKAKASPTAYYMPGSPEGGRAGFFEANTYDLKARPKWGMEALTMHEAVPGHHLQIAIGQEIEGLPEFRKHGGYTAFVEGWALYAEGLGAEMGFYQDPTSKYGALSYELWRAVRLVVDTGMHAKGWSRDKALDYFLELMPKSRLEAEVEIDRYITWPGQALAYKVGQLKFRQLRAEAEMALGEKFDVRQFHDEVLRHGALPMDILESLTRAWIQKQKIAKK